MKSKWYWYDALFIIKKKTVLGREQDYLSSFHNERRFKRIDNEMAYRKLSSYAAQKMSKYSPDAFFVIF